MDDDHDTEEDMQGPFKKAKQIDEPLDRVTFIPEAEAVTAGLECIGIVVHSNSIRGRVTAKPQSLLPILPPHPHPLDSLWSRVAKRGVEFGPSIVYEWCFGSLSFEVGRWPILVFQEESNLPKKAKEVERITFIPIKSLHGFLVENRVLSVSLSELKRPVKYFWAYTTLLEDCGVQYWDTNILLKSGFCTRDISENNIVLARRPGEESGYLIDFDMAILQEPEDATAITKPKVLEVLREPDERARSSSPITPDESKPIKALRMGTTPYISFNVLYGGNHTYFDDMESFLYVMLLFFFSYAGPLLKEELRAADDRGSTDRWADEKLSDIAAHWQKDAALTNAARLDALMRSPEIRNCLKDNWDTGLRKGIETLLFSSWALFLESRSTGWQIAPRTQVKHGQFIGVLDAWLEKFSVDEEKFSNCPFK
ncbi:hypothetical protein BU15DRAFT_80780 [Melanogaster broomeanus]|nr:hypothetical protein BU15DRAFT_80780 [Melanogaster broomeanus]